MSEYSPLVSIVIPAYNASNYLAEAIDSALAQTYKNVEIIVVNDGSKDEGKTRGVALQYGDLIRYIEKENGGSSSALNYGIQHMRGEWFSWLSHDDLYCPQKVQRQIEAINKMECAERDLYRQIFFSASELIDKGGRCIRRPSKRSIRKLVRKLSRIEDNAYLIAESTGLSFHGCSCLIHRDAFKKVGDFDEHLRLVNDVDMWFRLYAGDFRLHYIPEVLVRGRMHQAQISRSIDFSYHNPEQDMFWQRSLSWLKSRCSENYDVFFAYGKNAYQKTRIKEGEEAFRIAASIRPAKKLELNYVKLRLMAIAHLRSMAKSAYLKNLK